MTTNKYSLVLQTLNYACGMGVYGRSDQIKSQSSNSNRICHIVWRKFCQIQRWYNLWINEQIKVNMNIVVRSHWPYWYISINWLRFPTSVVKQPRGGYFVFNSGIAPAIISIALSILLDRPETIFNSYNLELAILVWLLKEKRNLY